MQGCATVTVKSIPFEKVVKVENSNKDQLYVRANNWLVDTFKDRKSVVQFTDKESGTISGRYLLADIPDERGSRLENDIYATIKIRVKDGAARIIVTPDSFTYVKGAYNPHYTKEYENADVNNLFVTFDKAMKKPDDLNF